MVVVMGEAGEAGHAARVVVAEPLQQLAQFLPALLVLQHPLLLLLGGHPVHKTEWSGNPRDGWAID